MPASSLEQLDNVLGQDDLKTDRSLSCREHQFAGIAQTDVDGLVAWSDQSQSSGAELRIIDEVFSTGGIEGVSELLRTGLTTSKEHARCDELFSDFELFSVAISRECSRREQAE